MWRELCFQLRWAADNFYKMLAVDSAPLHLSYDLFLLCSKPSEMATLTSISQHTSGNVYFYPGFRPSRNGEAFITDLSNNLTRNTGWETVMRMRCSRGLKISGFYGHFFIRSSDLLALPNVDCDKAFAVSIQGMRKRNAVLAEVDCLSTLCIQWRTT